jgi:hypothetical protein
MSASYSALQLGRLVWKFKRAQESLWTDDPMKIMEVDDVLYELDVALPPLADKMSRTFEKRLEEVRARIERRHRLVADENVKHFSVVVRKVKNPKDRSTAYHKYLVDESNVMLKELQRDDCKELADLLKVLVTGDQRLQGYFEIGYRLGEVVYDAMHANGKLSKSKRTYILAGLKKLPVREEREVEPVLPSPGMDPLLFVRRIEKLGRFLRTHEDHLIARPKWDGKTIAYRGQAEDVRIQNKSVMTTILDESQAQGWPDSIRLSPKQMANKRSVSNAIHHFQSEHKLVEFSINGDRIMWGPPGTMRRRTNRSTTSV